MARPAGLEPATYGLEGRCTIQLCYGRSGRSIPPQKSGAKWERWVGTQAAVLTTPASMVRTL